MNQSGAVWGTGVGVVLAAVSTVLVERLDGGWPWWIAAGVVAVAAGIAAAWAKSAEGRPVTTRVRLGAASIIARGNIRIKGGLSSYAGPDAPAAPERPAEGEISQGPASTASLGKLRIDGDVSIRAGGPNPPSSP